MSENCVNKTSLLAGILLSIALVSTAVCSEETSDAQRLFRAVENNEKRTVRRLVEADRRLVHARDHKGRTPLYMAVERGHRKVAQFLISQGADSCSVDWDFDTPLHLAAEHDHLRVVKLLIQAGANVNAQDNKGYAPLYCASSRSVVKTLVEHGDVNIQNNLGKRLLHVVACNGDLRLVRFLLKKGATVDQAAGDGGTALHWAAGHGRLKVVKHLIKKNANVDAEDHEGFTPLHCAVSATHDLDVVKFLIQSGADFESITRKDNQTPLSLALTESPHVAEYLIERYAAVNKLQAGISPSLQDLLSKRRAHLVEIIDDSPFGLPEVLRNEIIEFVTEI